MLPSISFSAVSFPFLVIISTERTWAYGCENYPQIYPCMNELHTPIKTLSTSHQRELCLRAEVHTMGLWGTGDTPRSNLKERLSVAQTVCKYSICRGKIYSRLYFELTV